MIFAVTIFFTSCVPTKKFNAVQQALSSARYDSALLAKKVGGLETDLAQLREQSANQKKAIDSQALQIEQQKKQIGMLSQQVADLKDKNGQLLNDAANKQSLLSKSRQDLINQQVKLEHLQALMDKQKKAIEEIRKKMTLNPMNFPWPLKMAKYMSACRKIYYFRQAARWLTPKEKKPWANWLRF
jgi:chemotaxis protein MotB